MAVRSLTYPRVVHEHLGAVDANFTHSSFIVVPNFMALLLYPTIMDAGFTIDPGVTLVVVMPDELSYIWYLPVFLFFFIFR